MPKGHHLYERGDIVTRLDGILGIVAADNTLSAKVRWDDGRTEIIEQGDPTVWNEGGEYTEDGPLGYTGHSILASWSLWRSAGPAPEPREEPDQQELLAA
jgi:hypothetical protein